MPVLIAGIVIHLLFVLPAHSQTRKPTQIQKSKDLATQTPAQASPAPSVKPKKTALQSKQFIRLQYGYPKWNTDSRNIDNASVLLRDGETGKLVQIALEETEPDSSLFSGIYSVSWANLESIQAEFYVPPQELLKDEKGLVELQKKIKNKEFLRKPFILRRDETGIQTVELFDTKEQAMKAMDLYKKEEGLRLQQKQIPVNVANEQLTNRSIRLEQPLTGTSVLSIKEQAKLTKQKIEQHRLEQIEKQKMTEREAIQNQFDSVEKNKRIQLAKELAKQGLDHYSLGDYEKATSLFAQSIELDPSSQEYSYQYGVSLYKTNQFARSLVILRLVDTTKINTKERDYYQGLNQFRLNDLEESLKEFEKAKQSGDAQLAPSASFYQGMIQLELKQYDASMSSFQYVLDHSDDARLDERSEAYIEAILRLQAYEKESLKKWIFSGNIGLIYDNNILLNSNAIRDQGPAIGGGVRSLLQGSSAYRLAFNDKLEWDVRLTVLDLSSFKTDFSVDKNLQKADPLVIGVSSPYVIKTKAFEKPYRLTITPAFESISMALENDKGQKNNILNSPMISANNTFIMSEDWITSYIFELRYDSSRIKSAKGDNDPTALRGKLIYTNLLFLNKKTKDVLIPDVAYTVNHANGKNNQFYRMDLGLTYSRPWIWNANWNTRIGYFLSNFPLSGSSSNGTVVRTDQNYSFSFGFAKPVAEHWVLLTSANYTINNSTRSSNQYDKYSVLTSMSFTY